MATTTANLGLTLPTPNVDSGWGGTLNTDFTLIDDLFTAAGSGTSVGLQVGSGKTLNAGGTIIAGGTMILGSGDGTNTVTAPTIRGAKRTGTNALGPNLTIDAINGTGTGGSGNIIFRTAPASVTPGTAENTMQTVLEIKNTGVVEVLGVNVSTITPAGAVIPYAGSSEPTGWLFARGQSVNRTTYAALFAAIGTTYGSVDGSSFNLPDLRGRAVAGRDDMGGTAANRLASTRTIAVSTISRALTTCTVVTTAANGLDVGGSITISGAGNAAFNGTWAVVSIISSTSFTFSTVSSGTISSVAGGTITVAIANGVSGATLGAVGGLSTNTLTTGQIPAHTHTTGIQGRDYSGSGSSFGLYAAGTSIIITSSSTGGDGPHNNVQPTLVLNYIIKT